MYALKMEMYTMFQKKVECRIFRAGEMYCLKIVVGILFQDLFG